MCAGLKTPAYLPLRALQDRFSATNKFQFSLKLFLHDVVQDAACLEGSTTDTEQEARPKVFGDLSAGGKKIE